MKGLKEAQHALGMQYLNGEGIPENHFEAYVWLEVAAKAGYDPNAPSREWLKNTLTRRELQMAETMIDGLFINEKFGAQSVVFQR